MKVRVLMFAVPAERAGTREIMLELEEGATVKAALAEIIRLHPALREQESRLATAVNQVYVGRGQVLHEGDELALIPPVSGG